MFIYNSNGLTDGMERIETSDFFERLVRSVVSHIHPAGRIFQIDLQLRPYGKSEVWLFRWKLSSGITHKMDLPGRMNDRLSSNYALCRR